jgi:hypothetical protein
LSASEFMGMPTNVHRLIIVARLIEADQTGEGVGVSLDLQQTPALRPAAMSRRQMEVVALPRQREEFWNVCGS